MQRLILVACGVIFCVGLIVAGALSAAAQAALEGNWVATKAETNGAASPEVVGHWLSFSGDRFEIRSRDGKDVFAGTVRMQPAATPSAIDFAHTLGALNGKTWHGIYKLDGDTLTVCDNAADLAKARPTAFETKPGSGFVLLTFVRAK